MFGDNWQRYHLRSNFSYNINPRVNFDFGLGGFYTTVGSVRDTTEIRSWAGTTFFWPDSPGNFRRFVLAHRLRYELRFFRESGGSDWFIGSRVRYRISTMIALNREQMEDGAFYITISAELFADITDDDVELFHHRNRLMVGLGWVTSPRWILELRYVYQRSKDSFTNRLELTDKILEFRVKTSVSVINLMKGR